MKKRDDIVYLKDLLDAIGQIESYVRDVSFQAFSDDNMRQDAIIRQMEIVGEAARNVSKQFQQQHSEITWSGIVSMRN